MSFTTSRQLGGFSSDILLQFTSLSTLHRVYGSQALHSQPSIILSAIPMPKLPSSNRAIAHCFRGRCPVYLASVRKPPRNFPIPSVDNYCPSFRINKCSLSRASRSPRMELPRKIFHGWQRLLRRPRYRRQSTASIGSSSVRIAVLAIAARFILMTVNILMMAVHNIEQYHGRSDGTSLAQSVSVIRRLGVTNEQ